jgi:hypothetical protein
MRNTVEVANTKNVSAIRRLSTKIAQRGQDFHGESSSSKPAGSQKVTLICGACAMVVAVVRPRWVGQH